MILPLRSGRVLPKRDVFPMISRNGPINIILADSNPLVLSALSEIVERDARFSLVATSSTAEGFLRTAMRVSVDIGVIDWNLPAIGGARLVEVLRDQPGAPRIVIYAEDAPQLARQVMATGAAGFAARSSSPEQLLEICADVAAGKMVFPYLDIRQLQSDPMQQLSRKERAALEALSQGLTNKELAAALGISMNTVKFHLSNLYEKLSVKNRSQAIAFYYASRLDMPGSPHGIPK